MLKQMFNVGSHVAAGAWTGSAINNPKYRVGVGVLAAGFLAYQIMGAWRKGDSGYPEVKEFLIGMAIPMVYTRVNSWLKEQ